MSHQNEFSTGKKKLKLFNTNLPIGRIRSYETICFCSEEWANGNFGGKRIKLINEVFEFYYNSINSINVTSRKKTQKQDIIEDAFTCGLGRGFHDLDYLFKQLAINRTRNYCDWPKGIELKNYTYSFLSGRNISLPLPIYNFATYISPLLLDLSKEVKGIMGKLNSINSKNVSEIIEQVISRSEKVENLVLIDKITNRNHRAITISTGRIAGKVVSFAKILSIIDSSLKDYKRAIEYDSSNEKGAIAYASLCTCLKFIPVLGELYANMLRFMPEAADFMKTRLNINRSRMRELGFSLNFQDL